MNDKPETGTIFFEVALLTIVVFLVDEWLIRGALAFIPAMLLAQRALDAAGKKASHDALIGEPIKKLQAIFREFHAMCHLMGSGGITSEQALERSSALEKDLNLLMEEVTRAVPAMAAAVPDEAVASPEESPEADESSPEVAAGLPTL